MHCEATQFATAVTTQNEVGLHWSEHELDRVCGQFSIGQMRWNEMRWATWTRLKIITPSQDAKNSSRSVGGRHSAVSYSNACKIISNRSRSFTNLDSAVDWSSYSWQPIRTFQNYNGDADAAVETRIRIGWNKFRKLVPLLTNKDISLIVRGRLYSNCVRSSMLHGSETWPVRKENEVALQLAEMRMVRWMCGVKLQERAPSKGLRD